MTRITLRLVAAVVCASAALFFERLLCDHATRQTRRVAVHPADGRSVIVRNTCPTCGASWVEYE